MRRGTAWQRRPPPPHHDHYTCIAAVAAFRGVRGGSGHHVTTPAGSADRHRLRGSTTHRTALGASLGTPSVPHGGATAKRAPPAFVECRMRATSGSSARVPQPPPPPAAPPPRARHTPPPPLVRRRGQPLVLTVAARGRHWQPASGPTAAAVSRGARVRGLSPAARRPESRGSQGDRVPPQGMAPDRCRVRVFFCREKTTCAPHGGGGGSDPPGRYGGACGPALAIEGRLGRKFGDWGPCHVRGPRHY